MMRAGGIGQSVSFDLLFSLVSDERSAAVVEDFFQFKRREIVKSTL